MIKRLIPPVVLATIHVPSEVFAGDFQNLERARDRVTVLRLENP